MGISGIMLIIVAVVIIFRILIEKFCNHMEFKRRLGYVAGMMLSYTLVLVLWIYAEGILISEQMSIQMTIAEFAIYLSAKVFVVNLLFGFVIILLCSTARKRSLSNRDKIKLKDLLEKIIAY